MSDAGFRRGDTVICAMPGDYGKPRPGVVVQSDLFNPSHASVVVCPITSERTGLDLFRVQVGASASTGLRDESEVMVDKVSAIRRDKVRGKIGRLSDAQMNLVDRALRLWLQLPETRANPHAGHLG